MEDPCLQFGAMGMALPEPSFGSVSRLFVGWSYRPLSFKTKILKVTEKQCNSMPLIYR